MYVCGPTVYDVPHVGHGRTAVVFDMIRRYLEWTGLDVTFVSNVTDVEDKIIARAAERGTTEPELAARVRGRYFEQHRTASASRDADHTPHATEYIERHARPRSRSSSTSGHAYVVDGQGVYFDVETLPGLRRAAAPHARGAARVGRRPGRGRRGEAQPDGLRALEGGQAGRARVGLALGAGPAGLAHRVLGDVARPPRRGVRPPRRRRRPRRSRTTRTSAPRPRPRATRSPRHWMHSGMVHGRRREDGEVARQLHHARRRARPRTGRARSGWRCCRRTTGARSTSATRSSRPRRKGVDRLDALVRRARRRGRRRRRGHADAADRRRVPRRDGRRLQHRPTRWR